jgi:hypothetical protein
MSNCTSWVCRLLLCCTARKIARDLPSDVQRIVIAAPDYLDGASHNKGLRSSPRQERSLFAPARYVHVGLSTKKDTACAPRSRPLILSFPTQPRLNSKQTQPGNISTLEASLYCLWELGAISPFALRRCLKCFKIFVDSIVEQNCRIFLVPTYGTRHIYWRYSGKLSALPTFLIARVVEAYLPADEHTAFFKFLSSRLSLEFDAYVNAEFGKCTIFD